MYLYGASGHGKVIVEVILSSGGIVEGVFDDNSLKEGLLSIPVIKTLTDIKHSAQWIVSIGNNKTRMAIAQKLKRPFAKALHSSAIVSPSCIIGAGSVVMAGAIINADTQIGEHCIINTASVVEHDCKIGDYVHLSPKAALAGNVIVGEGTHIGIGAVVIQGITIGKWVVIGAGAVIIRDIPDYAVVVGNPGKIIRYNDGERDKV